MNTLLDKLILLFCCILLTVFQGISVLSVILLLTAITLSCLSSYFTNALFRQISYSAYCVVCCLIPPFVILLPLLFYDVCLMKKWYLYALTVLAFCTSFGSIWFVPYFMTILFLGMTFILHIRTETAQRLSDTYRDFRDKTEEFSILMKQKNSDLQEKQDYEVNLATLNERNRIAGEIHDTVGHLLSSSILQIGAMMTINQNDAVQQGLTQIKDTLSQGMDSIRSSIHDLHDESIDLCSQLTALKNNFTFCSIKLDYGIENNPEKECKYCFISIVKEALSNIIKHSDATRVTITLREHPALYQLIIHDNGTAVQADMKKGIGIHNMTDRVLTLHGNINIDTAYGFKIFISVPIKEGGTIGEDFNCG